MDISFGITDAQLLSQLPPALSLPQELIDVILNELRQSKTTLSQCSLVCHAWLSTCRSLLFHKVDLTRRFTEHLASDEHNLAIYAPWIRQVLIEYKPFHRPTPTLESMRAPFMLLAKLPRLERLILKNWHGDEAERWIVDMRPWKGVKSLVLEEHVSECFYSTEELLRSFPDLEELKLLSVLWESTATGSVQTHASPKSNPFCGKLRSLETSLVTGLEHQPDMFRWVASFTHLESLIVSLDLDLPANLNAFSRLLESHAGSLIHLDLTALTFNTGGVAPQLSQCCDLIPSYTSHNLLATSIRLRPVALLESEAPRVIPHQLCLRASPPIQPMVHPNALDTSISSPPVDPSSGLGPRTLGRRARER